MLHSAPIALRQTVGLALLTMSCAAGAAREHQAIERPTDVAEIGTTRPIPTGIYELEAELGGRRFPVRLELLAVDDRPWGRLTVTAGREIVSAVHGIAVRDNTWRFAVGGPVRSMQLIFADSVTGTITLGGAPPIPLTGTRTADVVAAGDLRSHHVLTPLPIATREAADGASFPSGTAQGDLVFASHGPDLSHQTLMATRPTVRGWTDPRVLDISGRHSDRSPAVLPDGSAILFASDRPVSADVEVVGYRLWIASNTGSQWGEPRPVQFEDAWEHDARQPSITADGVLYFSSSAPGGAGEGDIYAADPVAPGRWTHPRNLGGPINGPGDEHGSFVAADGSYMVLTSAGERDGSVGGDDLYISLRTPDGWSAPRALALPVNTFANEYGAWVSPRDGNLYFTSDRYGYARIFRLDAQAAGLPVSDSG